MAYRLEIVRNAQKQMLALPATAQKEIAPAIDSLSNDPGPAGCKKLRVKGLWRIRIGQYRAVYGIDDKPRLVTVLKVTVRREDN